MGETIAHTTLNKKERTIMSLEPGLYFETKAIDKYGNEYILTGINEPSKLSYIGMSTAPADSYAAFGNGHAATVNVSLTSNNSRFASKMYGSVNGRSKLCFIGRGHRPRYPFGSIVYYTDYSMTDTATVYIYESSELSQLADQTAYQIVIDEVTIDTQMVKEVHLTSKATGTMGDYFLFGYLALDTIDIGDSKLTSIGNYAFSGDYALRENDIVLPQTLTHIGSFFMNQCANFCGVLDVGDLPATIITTDTETFATQGPNMPEYSHGLVIRGSTKWDWIARFPNNYSGIPYRNLRPEVDYGVVYYTSGSSVLAVELQNATEFNSLAAASASSTAKWTATVGSSSVSVTNTTLVGVHVGKKITSTPTRWLSNTTNLAQPVYVPSTVTSINSYFMYYSGLASQAVTVDANITSLPGSFMRYCTSFNLYVNLPKTLKTIGNYFMANCSNYNQSISIPSTVTGIGDYFLYSCSKFNKAISFPSLTSISSNFLRGCSVFNQTITLPSTLTSLGTYFLYQCNAMVGTVNVGSLAATIASTSNYSFGTNSSSAAMYTTGITIKGSTRANWISRFANRTSSPYRKLINGGS